MLEATEFAVVDVETTGLYPQRDRVIEIAILRVSHSGTVLSPYCSLLNPERDLGPTHVHGIRARDVLDAPRFQDIAGDIVSCLAGAVFVAHNVAFDRRFIESEFQRAGVSIPELSPLCTMRLARLADPALPRRALVEVCKHFGLTLSDAHTALGDVEATASVLGYCLGLLTLNGARTLDDIGVRVPPSPKASWPVIPPSGRAHRRKPDDTMVEDEPYFLARLISQLPAVGEISPGVEEYLALLDRVLEDRRIIASEEHELTALTRDLGLVQEQVVLANEHYLRDLILVALADSEITRSEMDDLNEVRTLLAISKADFESMLDACRMNRSSGQSLAISRFTADRDFVGKTVCFTGELAAHIDGEIATREFAQRVAAERGMIVKSGVSRSLDYLVMADPDSMSTKAKKAREYGVRVLAEPVFWRAMEKDVD